MSMGCWVRAAAGPGACTSATSACPGEPDRPRARRGRSLLPDDDPRADDQRRRPLGAAQAALEIAARYSDRRKAFGQKIRDFRGGELQGGRGHHPARRRRALVHATARCIDAGDEPGRLRRLVSETKKFVTEAAWDVVNHAMQIMGGIGYTNVYPIERLLRDARLSMIWTGTNEIMNLIIQHEYYHELGFPRQGRDVEADAPEADQAEEKVYE